MGRLFPETSTQISLREMKDRVQNALFLAAAAMIGSFPMFLYQFEQFSGSLFTYPPSSERLFYLSLTQSMIVFALAFLCALVGFLYSERLKLPKFGRPADAPLWLSLGLTFGLVFTPLSYLAIDRQIIRLIPGVFPTHWLWASANMLGGAITQEVIARFGLLTIGIYLLGRWGFKGHPWPAIALISLFGSFGTVVFLLKFELAQKLTLSQLAPTLMMVFVLQWIFGELYVRKGFMAALCVHFGLSVKLVIYALLLD
jgi:hypothetical protein